MVRLNVQRLINVIYLYKIKLQMKIIQISQHTFKIKIFDKLGIIRSCLNIIKGICEKYTVKFMLIEKKKTKTFFWSF